MQGAGILGAQLENVADFNAATQRQLPCAVRRRVAGDGVAQVGKFRLWEIAPHVRAGVVVVVLVGTDHVIGHRSDGVISQHAPLKTHRTE